jgi:Fur family peroxide stress response transcriptional regulator
MAVGKAEIGRRMQRFEDVCRRRGLKLTYQRAEIFRELAGTQEHPDAETIYRRVHRRIPAISLDTVYRTLGLLEAQGLVVKAEVFAGPARYDANVHHHHHFVCTRCGSVRDFFSPAMDRIPVPSAARALGKVLSCDVHLRGICARCARRRGSGKSS